MTGPGTWVTVHDPGRAAAFERVFGTAIVPVTSMFPVPAMLPGFGEPQPVYLIDMDWVDAEGHRPALVAHLAGRFGYDPAGVDADLGRTGMPILADGCTVVSDSRDFL